MNQKQKKRTDEVREALAEHFYGGYCELEDRDSYDWYDAKRHANEILNLKDSEGNPLIAVLDKDQSYPTPTLKDAEKFDEKHSQSNFADVIQMCVRAWQEEMIWKANFRKVIINE